MRWPERFFMAASLASMLAYGTSTHWGAEFWAVMGMSAMSATLYKHVRFLRIRRRVRKRIAKARAHR